MDWAALQNALKAWAVAISGLVVVWENEARPAIIRDGYVILGTPSDITELGQDYVQYSDGTAPTDLLPTVVGQRIFTVAIRTLSRSQIGSKVARISAERLRSSLKLPSVLAGFQAAGLAVVSANKIVQLDAPWDERVESICSLEIIFAAAATLADSQDQDTIGSMSLSTVLKDPGGTTLPTPPSLSDEIFTFPS